MKALDELPSELIFQIIDALLSSPYPIPRQGRRHRPTSAPITRQISCYASPDISLHSNALNLLLTSRRMFLETRRYLSTTPQTAKLDLITVDKFWIWPTIRTIPARAPVLDTVEINFIPCCTEGERELQASEGIRSFDRGEEIKMFEDLCESVRCMFMLWAVQTLFNQGYKLEILLENCLIPRINTLVININTMRYGNGNHVLNETEVPFRQIEGLAHLDFEKLYPIHIQSADRQVRQMCDLMAATCPSLSSLIEVTKRIDNVAFYVNGELLQIKKVAQR